MRWSSHARRSPGARSSDRPAVPWSRGAPAAFTLIELLTVIAIIGILSAVVFGAGRRVAEAGKIARARAELAALAAALESYRRQLGEYPITDDSAVMLQSLLGRPGPAQAAIAGRTRLDLALFALEGDKDPFSFAAARLVDPWQQPYLYRFKVPASGWTNPGYVLYSIGPDGRDAPAPRAGGGPDPSAAENVDNLYATP